MNDETESKFVFKDPEGNEIIRLTHEGMYYKGEFVEDATGGGFMKTLKEHDEERRKLYGSHSLSSYSTPNGIACPECGHELWDTTPDITLTSNPPQKNIHCNNCGYRGYRIA